jgi:hypothetical protein
MFSTILVEKCLVVGTYFTLANTPNKRLQMTAYRTILHFRLITYSFSGIMCYYNMKTMGIQKDHGEDC